MPTPPPSASGYESDTDDSAPGHPSDGRRHRLAPPSLAADRAAGGHTFRAPADRAAVAAQRRAAVARIASVGVAALQGRGLDLTRRTLPLEFFEPSSMLQRVASELAYWPRLLARAAAATDDPVERVRWVAAAAVASLRAAGCGGVGKPFNPLLGETFACALRGGGEGDDGGGEGDDGGGEGGAVLLHAEQVSHHPPQTAWQADGAGWRAAAAVTWTARAVAGGNAVKTGAQGSTTVTFDDGSVATWHPPPVRVSGVLAGDRVVRIKGRLHVALCTAAGAVAASAIMTVGPPNLGLDDDPATAPLASELRGRARARGGGAGAAARGRDRDEALAPDEIAGIVLDGGSTPVDVLAGSWLSHVDALGRPPAPPPAPRGLFGRRPPPPPPSPHARRLWDVATDVPARVADVAADQLLPSDSRRRRDVAALAAGRRAEAAAAKAEMEDAQRADAKARREGREE